MEQIAKMYVINKVTEYIRKRVLEQEIINKGAKGITKLQNILNDTFWDKAEEFILRGRATDNKYIPNFIEEPVQELVEKIFYMVKENLDTRTLLENILKEEKQDTLSYKN